MEIFSYTNDDMGSYTFRIYARASDINIPEISFKLDLNIVILECTTTEVTATEYFDPITLYFGDSR